jgi:STE24 endopeptidase
MREEKARRYHRIKNWLYLVNIVVSLGVLVLLLAGGFSAVVRDYAFFLTGNFFATVGVYFFLLHVIFFAASLPLDWYEGFFLEHSFELSTEGSNAWLKRHIKKSAISLIAGLLLVELLYVFLRFSSQRWWVFAGIGWLLFSLLFARIIPTMIVPLFYKYKPLDDTVLKERIMALAERCHIKILDVFGLDFSKETKKANAAVIGLGASRRVVVTDTLLTNFTVEEIEAVMAHEFGHHVLRHMRQLIIFGSASTFISLYFLDIFLRKALVFFGFSAIYDVAAFPIIALGLLVFGLVSMPLNNWFSRVLERRADLFALRTTNAPQPFISMMEKLSAQNLAEQQPSRFIEIMLYDHPPIAQRIATAKAFSHV